MANCFRVGGTSTWDGTNTGGGGTGGIQWATASGGSTPATGGGTGGAPASADTAIFDASSGGGTVTVNTTVNIAQITMGAFTGTLTFATNNNNVTLQNFSCTGSGTRTLSMGNGLWTITGTGSVWDMTTVTNLTLNGNSSTLTFTAATLTARNFSLGATKTFNNITVSANSSGGTFFFNTSNMTCATLTLVGGTSHVQLTASSTYTITTLAISGTAGSEVL